MSNETILFERNERVAWITLNRPTSLNATNAQMLTDLMLAIDEVRLDTTVRALVVTGAGDRAFCIGSDLAFLNEAFAEREFSKFRDYLHHINRVLFALEALPVPVIAMVQGKARAGGFEMILACDMVLIAEEAQIGDVHTPYGHMPGAGVTQRLARKIGMQRALELILTGKWLSGQEAVAYGIALRSAPRCNLRSATEELLEQLTDKTRDSLAHIKRAIVRGWDLPLQDGVNLEVQSYLEYLATSREPADMFYANQERRRARVAMQKGAQGE